jgi:hypothetical protein
VGLFGKADLDRVIAAGCTVCGDKRLSFKTYVDARIPMMGGEPIGRLGWAYDGEAFCDGVYEVACGACDAKLFSSPVCTRCNREGGLAIALSTPNGLDVPAACPGCDGEEIVFFGFVPAEVIYVAVRGEKAKTDVDLLDEGFHGFQAWCKTCGVFGEVKTFCPLCAGPGPLRERPK